MTTRSSSRLLWATLAVLGLNASVAGRRPMASDVRFTADRLSERLEIVPRDGSLVYGESDFELNATGFALALRRCYRSSNAAEGVFGRGWTCLLDRRIEVSQSDRTVLRDELGRTVAFAARGSSLQLSQTGRPQWLLVEKDGALLRDPHGQFSSFDKSGRLTGIYNAAMAGIEIEYEEGRVARLRDPYERSIRFQTDDKGRIIEAQSSGGDVRRYEYAQDRLARVSDAAGVRAEYSYDARGRLSAVVAAGAERAEIAYDSQGRVARLGGPAMAERKVRYDQRKVPFVARIVEIADALGHAMRYRFRDDSYQCQIALPDGATATVDYDKRLLPSRVELPQGRRIAFRYDSFGNLTNLTLPNGSEYEFAWTGRGDLRQWMRADGATFSFERTESGLLRQITGPRPENVRRLFFDGQGRLAWLAEGLARALVFSRNTRGDLSSLAVQGGPPSLVFDHDESGRLSRIATPGRPAFSAVYGPSGRPEAFTDAIGYRLGLARDRLGRLERIEDSEGRREQFERDASGRPNLWRRADGGETRLEFDPEGNRIEVRPPESRPARFAYDERNLATSETWLASQHQVQYDEFGCVTARRNGRGQVIRLFYDPLGRPSEIVRETQETARFQNALDGRVLRMAGRDLEYRFGNDERGRPSRVADAHNNVWAEYAFDAKDRVAALAASGGKWLYEYDTLGRLVRMALAGDRLSEVRYAYENDQARLPNRVFLPGGTNVACEYDPYGRIAAIRTTLRSGKTALAERYAYDGRGNVVRIESTDRRLEFEYDAQNRLAVQQLNGHVYARFQYGRDGRLLKMESDEGNLELVYDGDGRPTRSSQARFERDLDGNLTAQVRANGTTRYRFDAAGRLASVTPPTGAAITHGWSPNGWPIARTQRGQATGLSFLGDLPLYGARRRDNSSGWFVADPLWGAPLAFREGPRTDLAYRDALGRLRSVAEAGRDPIHTIAWGLLGRRSPPDSASFFDSVGLDAVGFDDAENLAGVHDPETGLSLAPRPLRQRLAAYSDGANEQRGTGVPPVTSSKAGETNLIEQIAAACAAGRFAPEEDAILRYLLDGGGSPGWPDPGCEETFDSVLDGGSFLTPSALSRRIVETVLRDGTGGLEASAFAPRGALPAAWTGLGSFRILCPTLTILPPVILEAGLVGETVWRDDPAFAAADNALHGWIGRLMARAADRSGARAGEDGDLRLLGELRELVRWTMNVPNRTEEEKLPVALEPSAPVGAPAERLALRDRFYSNLDRTP